MTNVTIEKQARFLARANREDEPYITKIYWFPDDQEVRLVELHGDVPPAEDKKVHPYFFRPSPADGLPAPSGVALIRPEEYRKLELPSSWGGWERAVELGEGK